MRPHGFHRDERDSPASLVLAINRITSAAGRGIGESRPALTAASCHAARQVSDSAGSGMSAIWLSFLPILPYL
jgi:hypothetical protein